VARAHAAPLRLHPKNPRYFLFRGRSTVLLTAGEHYGAVVNRDFDYVRYLEAIRSYGFNLTRLFTGSFVASNELASLGIGPTSLSHFRQNATTGALRSR
jgi:hypothetical protein